MDSNGYNPSIMGSQDGIDFLYGHKCETVRHEIFNGPNRDHSKEDGLWIAVTPKNHDVIHQSKELGSLWWQLMKRAEGAWLAADWTRTVQDFVDRYGKNYL